MSPGLRRLMQRTLEQYGYTILNSDTVNDAISIAQTHDGPIDLLLSDVVMPGLSGPDLAQRIVRLRPSIKVLYVSGYSSQAIEGAGSVSPNARFLPKPFALSVLVTKVRECLDFGHRDHGGILMRATVLIVDDDPGAAEAFAPMLNSHGYDVRVALDAESGMTQVDRCAPVAIVIDLHLPTVDGLEFVRRLRASARHSTIPAAVVTGDYLVDDAIGAKLQTMGVRLFFKPLWEDDLNRIIRDLVRVQPAGVDVGALLP